MSALLVAGAAAAIGALRPPLARDYSAGTTADPDTYLLPSPDQLVVLSLGYRSALADLLWAHFLVFTGQAFTEKRLFPYTKEYYDAVNTLEPTLRTPFEYADALFVLSTVKVPLLEYYKARAIEERALQAFPLDAGIWKSAGQFIAFTGASKVAQLQGEEAALEWERRGTEILKRACELGVGDPSVRRTCLATASLAKRLGETEAAVAFLERAVAIMDDEKSRDEALQFVSQILQKQLSKEQRLRAKLLSTARKADLPFVSLDLYLALEPPFETWRCAGALVPGGAERVGCATTWTEWMTEAVASAPDEPEGAEP